jgi:recombination protein RecT
MNENAVAVVCKSLVEPAMQDKFKQVLPSNVSLDRFTRVTLTAIQQNPAILECDRQSLYNSCVNAAQRGLLPDGKEGALVSFSSKTADGGWAKKAQFMAMVEGIIKEMAKAGIKAYAVSVYANDSIEIWNDDDGQHVKHVPVVFGDRGERIGALACARDSEGRTYVEAMNMTELEHVKSKSKSKNKDGVVYGPWASDPERMEQKSVLHRVRKRVPIIGHDEIVDGLREDDEDIGEPHVVPPMKDDKPATTGKRPKALQAVIDHDAPIPEMEFAQTQQEADLF